MKTELDARSILLGGSVGAALTAAIFCIAAAASFVVFRSKAASAPRPDAWEYQVIRARPDTGEMQTQVNTAAAQNWEFATAFPYTDSAYAVMRRLKK